MINNYLERKYGLNFCKALESNVPQGTCETHTVFMASGISGLDDQALFDSRGSVNMTIKYIKLTATFLMQKGSGLLPESLFSGQWNISQILCSVFKTHI